MTCVRVQTKAIHTTIPLVVVVEVVVDDTGVACGGIPHVPVHFFRLMHVLVQLIL